MSFWDLLAALLFAGGLFFQTAAAVGFARMPDVYCRLHALGMLDTLGGPLILLGVAMHVGLSLTAGKLLLAIALLYLTSPLVGHMLSWAALSGGVRPLLAEPDARREAAP